jgi:hypothetical protein
MAHPTVPPLERQLRRVRRRLFLQVVLDSLLVGWAIGLAVAACWLVLQPHLVPALTPLLRWVIAGGILALATVAASVAAALRRPSALSAALALDERFGLKERVTTSLTLAPADAKSSAAVALLDDVNLRVARLEVVERFPVRLKRRAWFVPVTAAILALVAIFYKPAVVTPKADADQPLAAAPEVRQEIDKKMEKLHRKAEVKEPDKKDRSAELERLEAELDRLTRQPRETKEQARELVKDLAGIEEQIKKREQELTKHAEALKEQMRQLARTTKKEQSEGPAKQLKQALEQGDMEKAREEMNRLSKQLKDEQEAEKLQKKLQDKGLSKEERDKAEQKLNELKSKQMSKEEKNQLGKQMQDIKEKVQRLSRKKEDKEKDLRDKADKGELSKDQLQNELDQLERDSSQLSDEDLQKLEKLADKLDKLQQALKDGDGQKASELLEEAGNEMGQLDDESELKELGEKLKDCEGTKGAMCDALDGKPVPAAGRRRESKDVVTNSKEHRERVTMDKGKLNIIDTLPGEGFKGPRKPAELTEEIRRASQEAPEAIDRQKLPRSASDMAKGYFDKMRGDREKKEKP